MDILVFAFEILGTIAFSISGVLVALKKKMDLFGVLILGLITAVGGGILRDILLGQAPPKVFLNPILPAISIVTSVVAFLMTSKHKENKHSDIYNKILFVMDTIGLAVFTVVGIETAQNLYGFNVFLNLCMGILTAVGGGVVRDLFSCEIPVIFTKHIYATASAVGALIYCLLCNMTNSFLSAAAAMTGIIALRFFASRFLWNLPKAE